MAFPTVAARTESNSTSDTSSVTINFTQTTGNAVVIFVKTPSATTLSSISDGFTDLIGGSSNFHILYKLALDGSEGGTLTYTQTSMKYCALAYNISGHATGTAPEKSSIASGTSSTIDVPSLAPSGGSKDYLWIAAVGYHNNEAADTDTEKHWYSWNTIR